MSEVEESAVPVTEPVLAQIPAGAPGRAYWFGVSVLIWALWVGLLSVLSKWIAPRGSPPEPDALFIFGGAVAFAAPLLLHPWLQAALLRRLGTTGRLQRRGGRWIAAGDRPLPRRAAIVVLLLPQLALALLGLAAMALGWFWAPFFIATSVASSTPERALAVRLRREPGCTHVQFRPDGVVLYGTGRDFRPVPAASLWVASLVMGAGWMLVVLVSGRGLIEVVANAAYELRNRHAIIPYRYQPRWLTLTSRHQVWVRGSWLRIEVTSVPPEARNFPEWPTLHAADVTVDVPVTGPETFEVDTVSDGHALISESGGIFLLQRGSRRVVRLSSAPLLLSGGIPSLPNIDSTILSRWRPGRVGAARIGRYRTQIYEQEGQLSDGPISTRLWISPDLPVPVRIEEKLPHEEREETLRSVRFDLPLPEHLFRLPAGAIVQDLHPRR
jgi:hypothetical protein